jgi:hypothetical protein
MKVVTMLLVALTGIACVGCTGTRDTHIEKRWRIALPLKEVADDGLVPRSDARELLRGTSKGDNFVISTQEEWSHIWRAAKKPTPNVDFQTHLIVGVYRLLAGDGIQDFYIGRIEKRDGGWVVYVKVQTLPPNWDGTTDIRGAAAEYVLMKHTTLPFVFAEDPYWFEPRARSMVK